MESTKDDSAPKKMETPFTDEPVRGAGLQKESRAQAWTCLRCPVADWGQGSGVSSMGWYLKPQPGHDCGEKREMVRRQTLWFSVQ